MWEHATDLLFFLLPDAVKMSPTWRVIHFNTPAAKPSFKYFLTTLHSVASFDLDNLDTIPEVRSRPATLERKASGSSPKKEALVPRPKSTASPSEKVSALRDSIGMPL